MKLIDLIAAIGGDPESEDKIQIVTQEEDGVITIHSMPVQSC